MNGNQIAFWALALLLLCAGGPVAASAPDSARLSLGAGWGMNYGGVGIGCEFNPRLPERLGTGCHEYFSLRLGLGCWPGGGLAYSFGLHAFPLGRGRFLQPRLSLQYGVVALADESHAGDEQRAEGAAFGAGVVLRPGRRVLLDADLHFIVPVKYAMSEMEGGRWRFSAGLRYRL